MRCPQCRRKISFPEPGLCADCYRQWKEKMRTLYGPGPWPNQPIYETIIEEVLQDKGSPVENLSYDALRQQIDSVLLRLENAEYGKQEFVSQLRWVLKEMIELLICFTRQLDD